jgi:hypothetical protein
LLPAPIQTYLQSQPDPEWLKKECAKISQSFPTTSELVNLAATLAHGRMINPQLAEQLAKEALELWKGCSEQRKKDIEQQARQKIAFEKALVEGPVLQFPFKFPISFDEFLRFTVGGKSKAARLKIYEEYAKEMIYAGHVKALVKPRNPAKKEIFKNSEEYEFAAAPFLNWLQQQPKNRAKKAAAKRWSQTRRKKATLQRLEKKL